MNGSSRESDVSVLAIVLTYNAPKAIGRCLSAIYAQTRPPDQVLVVDNGGDVPVSPPAFDAGGGLPGLEIVRLRENLGPAGGHAEGLRRFVQSPFTHAWVMDDDCIPQSDSLALLVARAAEPAAPGLLFPTWIDYPTGRVTNWPAWCGFLVNRAVVADVGLPRADFFWWAEDAEYLWWRIPQAGHAVARVDEAVVVHRRARLTPSKPPWKVYYEIRNSVYYRLFIQRRQGRRFYRLGRTLVKVFVRILTQPGRGRKLALYFRGIFDGLTGRLGKRVPVVIEESAP